MKKFKYFVSYTFKNHDNPNLGNNNAIFTCVRKMSPNVIRNFEKHLIEKKNYENVVIRNFKLL